MKKKPEKVLVTGSAGLIGSEAVRFFCERGFQVSGIDNDMRAYFFGQEASTIWKRKLLEQKYKNYRHFNFDIRNQKKAEELFQGNKFDLIIHAAAQPSHDWAAREPLTDFSVNAAATLLLLENFRRYCPEAVFIFTSTNKVYGDQPNKLPFKEQETRWELPKNHRYYQGIDESMSIDNCLHSIFGASKAAADILVQEYGKYFNLYTACFRGGCLTGPAHTGAQLHGFLAYLARCIATGQKYTIFGYKGKQVRDNIHSFDLVNAFYHFYQKPRRGEVYNIGGSRYSNISMIEAIKKMEKIFKKKANLEYLDESRRGDHIWYISDVSKFQRHYPQWCYHYDIDRIIEEICLSGHFALATYGSSMVTFFTGVRKPKIKIGTVFMVSYLNQAYGPVKALRLYLSSRAEKVISVEHSIFEVNRSPFSSLKHFLLNFLCFYSHRKKIDFYFGTSGISVLAGALLKKIGFPFKLVYYSLDYTPHRFKNPFLNYIFHRIDQFCVKNANFIWSVSPEIQEIRRKQGVVADKNILVRSGIRMTAKHSRFSKKSFQRRATLVIDGFLSNESLVKMAIKAVALLKKKKLSVKLKIVPGYLAKKRIVAYARRQRVSPSVEFLEGLPHQKIFSLYLNYGLGLALFRLAPDEPAVYRDAVEIKEFLGAGLPVVCSSGLQLGREIEGKRMGLQVKNQLSSLTEAISELLSKPEKYARFSQNALQYARQFTWEQTFDAALKKTILKHGK